MFSYMKLVLNRLCTTISGLPLTSLVCILANVDILQEIDFKARKFAV